MSLTYIQILYLFSRWSVYIDASTIATTLIIYFFIRFFPIQHLEFLMLTYIAAYLSCFNRLSREVKQQGGREWYHYHIQHPSPGCTLQVLCVLNKSRTIVQGSVPLGSFVVVSTLSPIHFHRAKIEIQKRGRRMWQGTFWRTSLANSRAACFLNRQHSSHAKLQDEQCLSTWEWLNNTSLVLKYDE